MLPQIQIFPTTRAAEAILPVAVVTLAEYTPALAVALAVLQYHNLVLAFHSNKHRRCRPAAILSVVTLAEYTLSLIHI